MLALVASAEAIFALPFAIARIFRPTMLEVFGITNTQLGTAGSMYGVIAMLSYLFGGPLADRFRPRVMMTIALLTTAIGGVYFATIPAIQGLNILFGYWGLTTILLFWAALIRATREWGGDNQQGVAYGILDGGRGLFAAALSTLAVAIFAALLPSDPATATLAEKSSALRWIILGFTGLVVVVGSLVWFALPASIQKTPREPNASRSATLQKVGAVLRMPAIWLNSLIIVCAYVNFKGSDDFSLLAKDVFHFDDVEAASVTTVTFWVRPVAALAAGLLGDRVRSSWVIVVSFAGLIIGNGFIAAGMLDPNLPWMLFSSVIGVSVAVYGLRGVYFALLQEAKVPLALTGTAAGVVSVVGYTPDIFMGPLIGYCTDTFPGALGHQYLFGVLALFSLMGLVASAAFGVLTRNPQAS